MATLTGNLSNCDRASAGSAAIARDWRRKARRFAIARFLARTLRSKVVNGSRTPVGLAIAIKD